MEVYYCAEDLVKTCNSALNKAVGSQVLTPFGGGGGEWGDHVRVKTWMFNSRELFVLS